MLKLMKASNTHFSHLRINPKVMDFDYQNFVKKLNLEDFFFQNLLLGSKNQNFVAQQWIMVINP